MDSHRYVALEQCVFARRTLLHRVLVHPCDEYVVTMNCLPPAGSITCRIDVDDEDVPTNSIDIEFADTTKYRNIRFTEQFDLSMAALGA